MPKNRDEKGTVHSRNMNRPRMLASNPRLPTITISFGSDTCGFSTKRSMADRKMNIDSDAKNTAFTSAPITSARAYPYLQAW